MGCGASRAVQRLEKKAERAERRHSDLTEAAAAAAQKALEQKEKREKQRVARQKSSIKLKDATASTHPRWSLEGTTCQAKCLRVVDGDTVEIAIGAPLYGSLRVRLLGIDTEENESQVLNVAVGGICRRVVNHFDTLTMFALDVLYVGLIAVPTPAKQGRPARYEFHYCLFTSRCLTAAGSFPKGAQKIDFLPVAQK